jgi:hypothetical protein
VHHVKADGGTSAKVFKGWTSTCPAMGQRDADQAPLDAPHHHAPLPPGPAWAGRAVNGRVVAEAGFELLPPL